jgi:transposase
VHGYYDSLLRRSRDLDCGGMAVLVEFEFRRVNCPRCGVKRECLDWLAANPRYTRRFVVAVGRRCRNCTIKDVAEEMDLHWTTVKEIDKLYMQEQLRLAGAPQPKAIGIDEISIGPGHSYRIVVSDLLRKRAIWFGGIDRSEASMDLFYDTIPLKKRKKIRLAVMDMWKAFRNSTQRMAPNAQIVFDKFHILKHLGEALDKVRKSEYHRLQGEGRRFIKGQKYTLLTSRENLSQEGRDSLEILFKANRRLNKAYLLKEQFGQLWDLTDPTEALAFFEKWKSALRWQRLQPYCKFAAMIERHWSGIVSYCDKKNKVPLGFVEGLNNKIRVIQRRAYGYQEEDYLRLKILTCMLPKL